MLELSGLGPSQPEMAAWPRRGPRRKDFPEGSQGRCQAARKQKADLPTVTVAPRGPLAPRTALSPPQTSVRQRRV